MSQAPVLYDFEIALSHVDRGLEQALSLKVARHPSETVERLWLRVLTYCWLLEERLAFGVGLSDPDAPDLECRDLTGQLTLWVRVGKADAGKLQRAADRNQGARVVAVFDSAQRLHGFLSTARDEGLVRPEKVELAAIDGELLKELGRQESRRSKATVTIVGDHFYIDLGGKNLEGELFRGSLA
jgi:uncharacterized protein YaeQ